MKKREEINYFESFIKSSNYAVEATKILREYIYNFKNENANEIEDKIHFIENEADKEQHTTLNYLVKDFIPPLDREDIIMLCHRLDDTVDSIDEVSINFNILDIETLRDDIKDFLDLLERCCDHLKYMMDSFKNIKKYAEIKEKVIEVSKLEEEGDSLYQKAIKNLYKNEKNPIEVIKWTTIYNCLEECFDSCEAVADCVEEIIMKNS